MEGDSTKPTKVQQREELYSTLQATKSIPMRLDDIDTPQQDLPPKAELKTLVMRKLRKMRKQFMKHIEKLLKLQNKSQEDIINIDMQMDFLQISSKS
jgi:hypothetical protein|tara:strand:+ start:4947 stop:5237 length:291 start_codon:yes stop_codon:yes gene_type:complete